jgi:hypothetical protein
MRNNGHKEVVGVPASPFSLTPEQLIRLVSEAVIAGVTQLAEFLPSKQVVAGSSPVSRSTKLDDYLPRLRRQS